MQNLRNCQNTMCFQEQVRGNSYTICIANADHGFRLDDPACSWQPGARPDALILGHHNSSSYVVFVEFKSVNVSASRRTGGRLGEQLQAQKEKAQVLKAQIQLLNGIYHFCPLCRCYNLSESNCVNHGESHHRRWAQDLGSRVASAYAGHNVRGAIVLLRINWQRTLLPPSSSPQEVHVARGTLGGQPICPRKPIPTFKIVLHSTIAPNNIRIPFSRLI